MSGSGRDWKLHSKGFDEELDEGQVTIDKCKFTFCNRGGGVGWGGGVKLKSRHTHTHIPLQGFNNKNLRFGCSDIGAAVQDLFLRLEAFCDKSWVQRADSLQVSRNTKDQKMSAAGIGGFLISNNILINDDDSNYRVFFTLGIP